MTSFHLMLAIFGLLTVFGLVMVLSASSAISYSKDGSSYAVFERQLTYSLVGLVAFWVLLCVPLRVLRRLSPLLLVVSVVLLAVVPVPGIGTWANGARKWFTIGPLSVQPVELAKVALALWGAHVLVIKRALLHQWRHLLVPVVPTALVMFALIMLQPDLGSTVTLGVVLIALLWFAGAPLRLFALIAMAGITAVTLLAVGSSYRLARLTSFLNPKAHTAGASQAKQAIFALADGGLFGKGLGQGSAKWQYLPNVYNDFIFAVVGEELGFVGCVVVLGLFATLAYAGLRVAIRNTNPWIRLVAASLTVWLVGQAAINIGYVVGLLPVTGIPLPMISQGGTSVVVTMAVFGILANCARHEPDAIAAQRSDGPGRFSRLLRLPPPDPYRPPVRRRPARPSPPPKRAARPTGSSGRVGTSGRGAAVHHLDERRRARGSAARRGTGRGGNDDRFLGGHS
jgi:cell division protein FtsW